MTSKKLSVRFSDFAIIAFVVYGCVGILSTIGVIFFDQMVRDTYTAALPDWYLPYGIASTVINWAAFFGVLMKRRMGASVLGTIAWVDFIVIVYLNQFSVSPAPVDTGIMAGVNLLLTFALISERKKFS